MKTRILLPDEQGIAEAGKILRNGGLVAIPTETVYGLAANALDGAAVKKIFEAKGRPQDNPLIVHISALEQIDALIEKRTERMNRLAKAFWPGPLTVINKKSALVPDEVTCGMDTVAVRFPSDPTAQAIITAAGVPLAAPSANLSGHPSPTTFEHCLHDLDGKVDALVKGGECKFGVESTVVTIAGEVPRLLRPGAVTAEQLREVLGELEIDRAVTEKIDPHAKVASPGMKYKHYAPRAHVLMLTGSAAAFRAYLQTCRTEGAAALCFDEDNPPAGFRVYRWGKKADHLTQAHLLFEILRQTDEDGVQAVYAHTPDRDGVGLAVYNRLIRAAGFEVVNLDEDHRTDGADRRR